MADPLRISARIEIDPSKAQQGAAEASKAVSSIGAAAEQTAEQLEKLNRAAGEGLRTPLGGNSTGAELDRLRAKYNPLYAVIMQYKQAQLEIRSAHAAGALSADEMTAALDRSRRSTLASIDAIKGRNKAIADTPVAANVNTGVRGFETANIAAQLQDIGVTAAMGMSPLQIALQQGTQLSAIIGGMQNPIRGLAAAFMSVVSPVSLVTIGVIAAGTAAIQYFSGIFSNANDAKSVLEGHAELIQRLKGAYGEAAEGLKNYADESEKIVRQDVTDSIKAYEAAILEASKSIRGELSLDPAIFNGATYTIEQMRAAIYSLDQGIKSGKPDLQAFIGRLIDIENQSGTPERVREIIKEIRTAAKDGIEAQRALDPLISTINGVGNTAAGQIGNIKAFAKALSDLGNIAMPSLTDVDRISAATNAGLRALNSSGQINEEARRRLLIQQARAELRLENQNPTVINSDGNRTNVPVPGSKPITLGDRDRAAERAASSTANAYRDLIKTADDRVAQMKLEAELAGQTGVSAEALRFKLDLLQRSEEKGRSLSAKQVEAINERVDAFKRYAEAAASATLKADLLFEREQMGRSAMDQQIAGGLRSAGLPIDFNSYEAGLLRTNYQLQYARDLAGDFTSTFFDGLRQGESVWDAFGNAGVKALQRIADTLMNDVLNSIFSVSGAGGGGGGGGLFSSLFSGFSSLFGGGGGKSFFPSAPGGLYAKGGTFLDGINGFSNQVVNKPTLFAFAKGTGLMGEDGAEAIMPLTRDASGRLGVSADVSPLMSQKQSAGVIAGTQRIELAIKLGLSVDDNGNIIPIVKKGRCRGRTRDRVVHRRGI
ncbi:phage tail length tape measure family protein [Agrobacterium pusense]|uniref:phage tail length tape measure family protein n=1 Tax=Agrobacterium pusense TaxID=648995 RepID=UPI000D1BEBC8|nr:phage tail length tape measure family protein [Agrobacterium pusense]